MQADKNVLGRADYMGHCYLGHFIIVLLLGCHKFIRSCSGSSFLLLLNLLLSGLVITGLGFWGSPEIYQLIQ